MPEAKMSLEEASTRLHTMVSFFDSLRYIEEIINAARSVDNIKQLSAERMAAAEEALHKKQQAQKSLAAFELSAAKKQAEMEETLTKIELSAKQRMVDLDNEYATRRMQQEDELKKLKAAFQSNADALNSEISELMMKRDDMAAQVTKVEASLAALRKKVEGLL